jgi:hypothetical protein
MATAKQLAARKLFAQRAKAGTLRTGVRKRAKNPAVGSMRRYALRSYDPDAGVIWSVGEGWKSELPKDSDLLIGAEVDDLYRRHPQTEIVDVVVYKSAMSAWNKGFRSVIPMNHKGETTHALRQKARMAGNDAMLMAGYPKSMLPGARRKNPSRGGNDAIHIDIDSHNTRGKNVRAKNPVKSEKLYTVHVSSNGVLRYHIAHFRRLKDAKEYAQAYADKYKTEVAITSKAL